jgi:hypothetical protein
MPPILYFDQEKDPVLPDTVGQLRQGGMALQ